MSKLLLRFSVKEKSVLFQHNLRSHNPLQHTGNNSVQLSKRKGEHSPYSFGLESNPIELGLYVRQFLGITIKNKTVSMTRKLYLEI